MMKDPYLYSDSYVLKNKLHIKDPELFNAMESLATAKRIGELSHNPVFGKYDLAHLQKIHKYIFQDVYDWAGKVRKLDIQKANSSIKFCPAIQIDSYQKTIFDSLKKENYLQNLDIEQFSKRAGHYLGELNALHPFREGNGRAQREFIRELALDAGYDLHFDADKISQQRIIDASIRSMVLDSNGLVQIIRESIEPIQNSKEMQLIVDEIIKAPSIKELKRLAPAKDIYKAFAKATLENTKGIWLPGRMDQLITQKLLKTEISTQRIIEILRHSPEIKSLSVDMQIKRTHHIVKELSQSIKRSLGMER